MPTTIYTIDDLQKFCDRNLTAEELKEREEHRAVYKELNNNKIKTDKQVEELYLKLGQKYRKPKTFKKCLLD
jgi:hypothetical protein